ncbi:C40 family peptidase [Streptomyces sparsus]
MTGAASPASAEKQASTDTVELPSLDGVIAPGSTKAAHVTQTIAIQYELDAAQDKAAEAAGKAAAKAKKKADAEEARQRAEAARKAAEAEERAAEERAASRSSARTTLSTDSGSNSGGGNSAGTSTQSAPSAAAPASGNAASVVNFARAQVGKAYVMGSTGPNAYDCSGLTTAAFRQVGVSLPRTSQAQSTAGTEVGLGNLQPGDILYWGGKGSATHVAIYVGGGKYVGAQNPSAGVAMHDLGWGGTPSGAVRVL